jgi:hypothetical protein
VAGDRPGQVAHLIVALVALIDVEDMALAILWSIRRTRENGGEFLAVNAGRMRNV